MGKRGPRRTPTAILKLTGSNRVGKRRDEPKPELGKPDAQFIESDSQAVFDQVCELLDSMSVLAKTDGGALERYARMFVRWRRAEQFIEKYGESYPTKDKDGNMTSFQQFPQVAIARTLSEALRKIESEFGLTPASRASIQVQRSAQVSASDALGKRTG